MDPVYLVALFCFGLVFGSFANVVVWRVPRGESLAAPGSHCPACDRPIRWSDNIPVVSWVLLRGRCRDCGSLISRRYPLIEASSGLLWLTAGLAFGPSPALMAAVPFFYLLMILGAIDLETGRLPNPIVSLLAAVGVAAALTSQLTGFRIAPLVGLGAEGVLAQPSAAAFSGVVLGGLSSAGLSFGYERLRGTTGLGFGDVKLLAAMGLFLGPYVVLAMFLGSLLGTLALPFMSSLRGVPLSTARIRFGPFLALGGLLSAVAGPALLRWYIGLF